MFPDPSQTPKLQGAIDLVLLVVFGLSALALAWGVSWVVVWLFKRFRK